MYKFLTREEVERAARLINWMAGYIGTMAPGHYEACYEELNEHFLTMERLGVSPDDPSKGL